MKRGKAQADGSAKKRSKSENATEKRRGEEGELNVLELLRENRNLRQNVDSLRAMKEELEMRAERAEKKLAVQNQVIKRYRRKLVTAFENDEFPASDAQAAEVQASVQADEATGDEPQTSTKVEGDVGNGDVEQNSLEPAAQTSSDSSASASSADETEEST